ncbi:hypothetical protein KSP35_21885 [Aquihabitans sp. G128]|uniref:hypothetical protein n=1 Tax=Aquihabitans sp. G128 TaxID=2849779 RepID=UPI001C226D3C|nr:hypothetical protein [Aquihabitans sp. G128]QXC60933.1 hypothetical protein KSP35_21885 [Aquihabitans sp. G128]
MTGTRDPNREAAASGPLEGRHVRLVPAALASIDRLYEIALCSGAGTTWRTRGLLVGPEQFADLITGELGFALTERATGLAVGHVGLHGLDPLSGTGELTAFVDPRRPTAGIIAGEGIDVFLDYAFRHAGVRKVTVEMPAGPAGQLARLLNRRPGLTHEGVRRAHVRIGQEVVDLHIYALWAEPFLACALARPTSAGGGVPTFAELLALIGEVAPRAVDHDDITGGHALVDDLGLDSLALLELVDALDARVAPLGPLALSAFEQRLTVHDLLVACEVAVRG